METTAQPQPPKASDQDALIIASFIWGEAHRTLAGVHGIVAALLHYALIGAVVANNLIELSAAD